MTVKIKLLISDFDGTLVDTFEANLRAYQEAFGQCGLTLTAEKYHSCFGLRFDKFMSALNILDPEIRDKIKTLKATCYPRYFEYLRVNTPLLEFIRAFHRSGHKTAIASTARRKNLMNVLTYIHAVDAFDLILAGEEVKEGKPSPEIYQKALTYFDCNPTEALVFEDSEVGFQAAKNAGINYVAIKSSFYGN